MFVGFALVAWRLMNDRLLAGLVLLGIPLFAFVSLPQFLYERVEISDKMLVHRREPPHTKYNGKAYKLPSNVVLTAASPTINRVLDERGIPRKTTTIDRAK